MCVEEDESGRRGLEEKEGKGNGVSWERDGGAWCERDGEEDDDTEECWENLEEAGRAEVV